MWTVLDVENSTFKRPDGTTDLSPYHPNNRLVSVGWGRIHTKGYIPGDYVFFHHNKLKLDSSYLSDAKDRLQGVLNETTLLIGHNLKHDLSWLLESGFQYDGALFDTMIGAYLLERGQKTQSLSLDALTEKYEVTRKKTGLIDWEQGAENVDPAILQEYGEADIRAAGELAVKLLAEFDGPSKGMKNVMLQAMEFCQVLTDIERNGIKIDTKALDAIEAEYRAEKVALQSRLQEIAFEVMGDRPVNLASPEQLSQVIYSRKLNDKAKWKEIFNIGLDFRGKPLRRPKMDEKEFAATVKANCTRLKKTKAIQCGECQGKGKVHKLKKDNTPYAKAFNCKRCEGEGVLYLEQASWAGFKFSPKGVDDVAVGGFATDKETLKLLKLKAETEGNKLAIEFLSGCIRLNALDTYLDSFVGGIRRGLLPNEIIHPKFNQTVAATQRLSSSEPNFQNMPREGTFPIKRAIVSRWEGGQILDVDFSSLEFRIAGFLCRDEVIYDMVKKGIDAHKKTGSIIFQVPMSAVTKEQRQQSKAHSFAPLFGAMGFAYPEHIKRYYQTFTKVYPGVGRAHKEWQDEAINCKVIRCPDGKEFAFPTAKRLASGGSTFATQIKNYKIQYFATGNIVPMFAILLHRNIKKYNLNTLIINEVHDSVVMDVPPEDNLDNLRRAIREARDAIKPELFARYAIDFDMPLAVEAKIGPNGLNMTDLKLDDEDEIPF